MPILRKTLRMGKKIDSRHSMRHFLPNFFLIFAKLSKFARMPDILNPRLENLFLSQSSQRFTEELGLFILNEEESKPILPLSSAASLWHIILFFFWIGQFPVKSGQTNVQLLGRRFLVASRTLEHLLKVFLLLVSQKGL